MFVQVNVIRLKMFAQVIPVSASNVTVYFTEQHVFKLSSKYTT